MFNRTNGDSQIEQMASMAFLFGHMDAEDTGGPGELLRRILGPGGIELVDIGAPGTAKMETRRIHDGPTGVSPCRVRIPARQRPEDLTLSAAYGCALYVAWARICIVGDTDQLWDETQVRAVAMAIAMPIDALEDMMRASASLGEIAHRFVVDPAVAAQRMRMIRGARHDSGERPAVEVRCNSGVQRVAKCSWDDETPAETPTRRRAGSNRPR